jgi:hypothetical protein
VAAPDHQFYHLCLSEITQLFSYSFAPRCACPTLATLRSRLLCRPVSSLHSRALRPFSIYILLPVSVKGWKKMFSCFLCAALRAPHIRDFALAAAFLPYSIPVLLRFPLVLSTRARSHSLRSRGTATRTHRHPYLHRIVPMSICANFGPDRPSRLAAYSEHNNTAQDRGITQCANRFLNTKPKEKI